jgi:phage antirepressor YoqD-like protein
MSFVNEAGLYQLIFASRKKEARIFQNWIFNEVLPQIRKTGSYNAIQQPQLPANYIDALKALVVAEEEKQVLLLENTQKQELLEKQAPQIEKYNQLHNSDGEFSLQEAMKSLHLKPNKAIDKLRELNYIFSTKQYTNYAYQKYIDNGLFIIKTHTLANNKTKPQTYITAKGLAYFREILHKFNDCSVDKVEYKYNPYLTAKQNENSRLAFEKMKNNL